MRVHGIETIFIKEMFVEALADHDNIVQEEVTAVLYNRMIHCNIEVSFFESGQKSNKKMVKTLLFQQSGLKLGKIMFRV